MFIVIGVIILFLLAYYVLFRKQQTSAIGQFIPPYMIDNNADYVLLADQNGEYMKIDNGEFTIANDDGDATHFVVHWTGQLFHEYGGYPIQFDVVAQEVHKNIPNDRTMSKVYLDYSGHLILKPDTIAQHALLSTNGNLPYFFGDAASTMPAVLVTKLKPIAYPVYFNPHAGD